MVEGNRSCTHSDFCIDRPSSSPSKPYSNSNWLILEDFITYCKWKVLASRARMGLKKCCPVQSSSLHFFWVWLLLCRLHFQGTFFRGSDRWKHPAFLQGMVPRERRLLLAKFSELSLIYLSRSMCPLLKQPAWPEGRGDLIGQTWVHGHPWKGRVGVGVSATQTIWAETKEGQVPQGKSRVLLTSMMRKWTRLLQRPQLFVGLWGWSLETEAGGLVTELPGLLLLLQEPRLLSLLWTLPLYYCSIWEHTGILKFFLKSTEFFLKI